MGDRFNSFKTLNRYASFKSFEGYSSSKVQGRMGDSSVGCFALLSRLRFVQNVQPLIKGAASSKSSSRSTAALCSKANAGSMFKGSKVQGRMGNLRSNWFGFFQSEYDS